MLVSALSLGRLAWRHNNLLLLARIPQPETAHERASQELDADAAPELHPLS
jgi:hypothetical protein